MYIYIYFGKRIWQTRDIVHPQEFYSRGRGVPARIFFDSLAFFHDTRRQENILRNITRPCNGSRLECSSHERYSLVLRQCRFSKTSIGYVGDATPRRGRAAAGKPGEFYDNEFLGDSITRRWNSIGICRRARRLFLKLCIHPPAELRATNRIRRSSIA